jgi:hypothetical protein
MSTPASSIPAAIRDRISAPAQPRVWTPEDFADLGPLAPLLRCLSAPGFGDRPKGNGRCGDG